MRFIGFDLGDGESAVALLTEDSVVEPVIQTVDGKGSVLSVVGSVGDQILIGEKALTEHKARRLRARFKRRFLTDSEAEKDIERFAYGLRAALSGKNQAFSDTDTFVALGCPAGWHQEERERYLSIMHKAGLTNVYIVSESRAAFFYAKYAHELKVDPSLLNKTTMVIDIGSSTTDFAYIVNGRESSVGTYGNVSLGGGLIEAYMLKRAVAKSPLREELIATFRESVSWRNRCEIIARRLKEQYFLDENAWEDTPCVASATVWYDEPLKIQFEMNADIVSWLLNVPMRELNNLSFNQCLRQTLAHAAEAAKENPPELLILTGGASRMRFFQDACREAFPSAVCVTCPNPEYSIAKGLAYAARVDYRLEKFNEDIQAYFATGDIKSAMEESLPALIAPLSGALSQEIIRQAVLPVVQQWKNGELKCLNDLQAPITARTRTLFKDIANMPSVEPVIRQWCEETQKRIQPKLDAICDKHNIDRKAMSMDAIRAVSGPDAVPVTLDSGVENAIVLTVTGILSALLFGGSGIALIEAGVVGLIIGAIIGVVAAYFGKMAVDAYLRRASWPHALRVILAGIVSGRLSGDKQRRAVQKVLIDTMNTPDFTRRLATDITITVEDQIAGMAKAVEMPIA